MSLVKRYDMEQEIMLPREEVWTLLSNTDHLNRIIGLFAVNYGTVEEAEEGLFRTALSKVAGLISIEWKEYPFEWIENKEYSVVRKYMKGPLKQFYGGIWLEDVNTTIQSNQKATKVHLFAEFTPRNLLGLAASLVGKQSMVKTFKYLEAYIRLSQQNRNQLPQLKSQFSVNESLLAQLLGQLNHRSISLHLIHKLEAYLKRQGDDEVTIMRPYEIAMQWGEEKDDVLRMFLHATVLGITNLRWNLICPNCRVSKENVNTLNKLKNQFHCDFCGIDYQANFDRYVELTFSVHPNIRKASVDNYCIGGPNITPHITMQVYLSKGDTKHVKLPDEGDNLRFRVLRSNKTLQIDPDMHRVLTYNDDGWQGKQTLRNNSGNNFELHNTSSQDIVVVVEDINWSDVAVTAAKVSTLHEFRQLFSSEVLAPGQQVGIENITIMFTDLRGSTNLYEIIGDAPAYGQVRNHFDYMSKWIQLHQGAIIKTMGDAVMAVFQNPSSALSAARDIQSNLDQFNRDSRFTAILKIGLHHGPAVAVNENNKIDFFGRTVNIAARIQAISRGSDVVLSKETFDVFALKDRMFEYKEQYELESVSLKGISDQFPVIRYTFS
jgi:adenylate cyclase